MLGMEIPVENYSELETAFVNSDDLIRMAELKKKEGKRVLKKGYEKFGSDSEVEIE